MSTLEHFARVRLGTCRYPETLAMLLRERGYRTLPRVRTGQIVNAQKETEVDIVVCMLEDLGIPRDRFAPYLEISAAGQRIGMRLCPGETYLQLLLQYEAQLRDLSTRYYGGWVTVVSDAIPDAEDRSPYVMQFRVYDGRLIPEPHWFRHYKDVWGPGPFLFMKRRR